MIYNIYDIMLSLNNKLKGLVYTTIKIWIIFIFDKLT